MRDLGGGKNDTSKARGYTHKKEEEKKQNRLCGTQLCSVSMAVGPKPLPPDVGPFTARFCPNSISSLSH